MPKLNLEELKKLVRKANEDTEVFLTESSYNRVRGHIENGAAFVIITSDRHERSGKENRALYQEMKQSFKNAGFPFTELKGGFKETTKTVTDPETGEEKQVALEEPVQVTENTILITSDFRPDVEITTTAEDLRNFATQTAQEYNQEAFIFGEQVTSASGQQFPYIRAYDTGGNAINESWAGPWNSIETVEGDAEFWSRIKGKHFQLRERKKTSQPRSWIEALKKSRSGETW
jgi:hypothetical protein